MSIEPYKNYYIGFSGINAANAVRCPRLSNISGDYVKISIKQLAISYTSSVNLDIVMGRLYLEGVGNSSMFSNDGLLKQAIFLLIDKTAGTGNDNFISYRANSSDEFSIIARKEMVSGYNLYITNDVVGKTGGFNIVRFDCILEISDACIEKCHEM